MMLKFLAAIPLLFMLVNSNLGRNNPIVSELNTLDSLEQLNPLEQLNLDINRRCAMCETLVSLIKFEMNLGNNTISFITKVIEGICKHIPGPSAKECYIISNDISVITKFLDKGMNATTVCKKINFCNETISNLSSPSVKVN